jgi:hypothetical protein
MLCFTSKVTRKVDSEALRQNSAKLCQSVLSKNRPSSEGAEAFRIETHSKDGLDAISENIALR